MFHTKHFVSQDSEAMITCYRAESAARLKPTRALKPPRDDEGDDFEHDASLGYDQSG